MRFWIERQIGKLLLFVGVKPSVSTGIGGDTTYGYGELGPNGYWQYPCYPQLGFIISSGRENK